MLWSLMVKEKAFTLDWLIQERNHIFQHENAIIRSKICRKKKVIHVIARRYTVSSKKESTNIQRNKLD